VAGRCAEKARGAAAKELGAITLGHCDVTDPATIDAVFAEVKTQWGEIEFRRACHCILRQGRADGRYLETTQENFTKSMLISCYSLTAITQRAEHLD